VIYSTGKVTGKIRYGKVVIEEGGQLSGEIEFGTAQARLPINPVTPVRPGLQVHSNVG
jgi:cytoskeletal protein CcmA (bactofilin family)